LTFLEAGSRRFFGGPTAWHSAKARRENRAEWVEDTHYERELQPGETLETFVCTDGDDERVAKALGTHAGPLLWKLQIRRGLVEVRGREFSATAVIGVEFTTAEVARAG
jgi:hypothetical protein